jgi:Flp pilus assembly protein TadG
MIRIGRLFRLATDGASSIEFALISAFLMIPLVLGVYDFGTALWSWMQVGNAARAGAQFINVNGYSSAYTTSGNTCPSTPTNTFTCAVQGDTSLGVNVLVWADQSYCGCQNGTTFTGQGYVPPCNVYSPTNPNTCPAGQTAVTLAQVNARYNYKPIFNYLVFGSSGFDISSQATALIY